MAKFRLIENAVDRLLGMIAYDVEAEAVERTPVCSGQLRNSIGVQHPQRGLWIVGTNLKYAPAVHDGRPAITIKPKRKKALAFWRRRTCPPKPLPEDKERLKKLRKQGAIIVVKKVRQRPRRGKPFLREAVDDVIDRLPGILPHYAQEVGLPDKIADEILRDLKVKVR